MSNPMTASWALEEHQKALVHLAQRSRIKEEVRKMKDPVARQVMQASLAEDESDWNLAFGTMTRARTILLEPHIQRQLAPVSKAIPEGVIVCTRELLWTEAGFLLAREPFGYVEFQDEMENAQRQGLLAQGIAEEHLIRAPREMLPVLGIAWEFLRMYGTLGSHELPEEGLEAVAIVGFTRLRGDDQNGGALFPCVFTKILNNLPVTAPVPTYTFPAQEGFQAEMWNINQWVLTINTWLQQKILGVAGVRADRGYRRRIERGREVSLIRHDQIDVIQMRRQELVGYAPGNTSGADVDWQWSWIVSGHWRNQYLPSSGGHRLTWISPYVKGPEDKPLKPPSPTVYTAKR